MSHSWSRQVAIAGIGESDLGLVPDKDPMQLHAQAAKRALEDCGLKNTDVDGVLTTGTANRLILMHSVLFAEHVGIRPRFTTSMQIGGATIIQMVISAANAIHCGMADVVLIASADSIRSFVGYGELMSIIGEGITELYSKIGHSQFECPYGPTLISTYALAATRHMHEYGTTHEQLAQVAVSIRKHASMHPDAQKREPLTVEDVLSSKMISWPLTKDMCSIISDGGAALVVTSAERARDLKKKPVLLLGAGARTMQEHVTLVDDLVGTAAADAGRQAYEMAGLGPKDMHFAQFYDCFSITPILFLEDFDFCEKGDGGRFVEGGKRIEIGGEIPIVTHGGCHAHCHPGLPSGIFHITEAVKQLRGEVGGARQVKNARVGLVTGLGGHFSCHTALILGTD
ncbi:MAG: thiolase family protein [Candidatus Abyssobacteria bacterium SURF_17]|uniref:Thiolase family protein n=1 Tax=Candidatus Abyssobacteria bacterium SURF_17 TaxID=2093361 RepID=A0A419EV46_9BACT|nr:MAG: thiolase family protein [Candidatus Abyssubacteria bacterium SURF_17]